MNFEFIVEIVLDAAMDTLKLVPFLFITYLVMEYLERKTEEKTISTLAGVGRLGPLFGAAAGVVPQCGFSAAAASLFSGGVISLGSLMAVFLSTSDEMLPVFISSAVPIGTIIRILAAKFLIGAVTGLVIDAVIHGVKRLQGKEKHIHDLCEAEHCGCEEEEGSIFLSALTHTLHIVLFIFIASLVIGGLVESVGEDVLTGLFTGRPLFGVVTASLIGLIPNCAASVMLTQMYLGGMLSAGQMIAGLLVGAGVGLLVLFRTNRRLKENICILLLLFALGIFWGMLIEGLGIAF